GFAIVAIQVMAPSISLLPFGLGGKAKPAPVQECNRVIPRYVADGIILTPRKNCVRAILAPHETAPFFVSHSIVVAESVTTFIQVVGIHRDRRFVTRNVKLGQDRRGCRSPGLITASAGQKI